MTACLEERIFSLLLTCSFLIVPSFLSDRVSLPSWFLMAPVDRPKSSSTLPTLLSLLTFRGNFQSSFELLGCFALKSNNITNFLIFRRRDWLPGSHPRHQ